MWGLQESERRLGKRRSVRMAGWIDPGGVSPVVECLVVDLHERGARLLLANGLDLPEAFELRIDDAHVSAKAQVRWRHHNQFGVEFMEFI